MSSFSKVHWIVIGKLYISPENCLWHYCCFWAHKRSCPWAILFRVTGKLLSSSKELSLSYFIVQSPEITFGKTEWLYFQGSPELIKTYIILLVVWSWLWYFIQSTFSAPSLFYSYQRVGSIRVLTSLCYYDHALTISIPRFLWRINWMPKSGSTTLYTMIFHGHASTYVTPLECIYCVLWIGTKIKQIWWFIAMLIWRVWVSGTLSLWNQQPTTLLPHLVFHHPIPSIMKLFASLALYLIDLTFFLHQAEF